MEDFASIIIVTYNQRKYLTNCLRSLSLQEYPHEIILVDNGSIDGTVQFVENNFGYVKIIQNTNRGYGAGNNLGVTHAKGKYIVIINVDTIVEKNWLAELIFPLKNDKNLVTTSKILMYDGLSINTCGNINHFTGLSFISGLGKDVTQYNHYFSPTGISGACFAIKKEEYLKIGGFDENIFLYKEDTELSWRLHIHDFQLLFVPTSIIKHDYKIGITPEKFYHLEKGRYIILRKYYPWKTIFLFCFSLMAAEILSSGYAVKLGKKGILYKIKAIHHGLRSDIVKKNNDVKKLIQFMSVSIPSEIISGISASKYELLVIQIANKIFKLNYWLVCIKIYKNKDDRYRAENWKQRDPEREIQYFLPIYPTEHDERMQ